MAEEIDKAAERGRVPWPLTGAALVAMAALYITGGRFVGLPILALLLLGSYATAWRIETGRVTSWALRLGVGAIIVMAVGLPEGRGATWYFEPGYTRLIGCLLAAEIVLPAWQRGAGGWGPRGWGVLLLLSALVMTAASNTYERLPIHLLAPLYMLLAAMSLREIGRAGRPVPARVRSLVGLRVAAVLVALGFGATVVAAVTKYDQRLASWAVEMLREQKASRSESIGFGGSPRLRAIFNPEQSPERALLIEGPPGERHLRVLTFDVYENTIWRPVMAQRTFVPVTVPTNEVGQRLGITRLADLLDLLPVPSEATAVRSPGALEQDEFGGLRDHDAGSNPSYEVRVRPSGADAVPLAAAPTAAQRARLLAMPAEVDTRVAQLARTVAGEGDAMMKVARIQQHLRAKHAYSLSFEPAGEPLGDFILNNRSAHCQYFASAVVVMARAAGVPARFVAGYYAHEAYGAGMTVVRERDAHAWAECWVDGVGWVTVDATPAGGRPDALFPSTPTWRQWWERIVDWPGRVRRWFGELSQRTVALAIAIPAAGVIAVWAVRRIKRRRRRGNTRDPLAYLMPRAELVEAGRRFEAWLRRQGAPCAAERTWREHVRERGLAVAERFVDAYDAARFGGGGGGGGDADVSRVRGALDGLGEKPEH